MLFGDGARFAIVRAMKLEWLQDGRLHERPHSLADEERDATYRLTMARNGDPRRGEETGTHIITKTRPKTKRPSLYKVLLLNDDYTPMDFVVLVLERFFNKPPEEATRIMLHVHQKGVRICGVYTYEVAETKVAQVTSFARQHEHPLQCTMEKE
jgi:ATP-dependent Clp protease adaptor protein ClpS